MIGQPKPYCDDQHFLILDLIVLHFDASLEFELGSEV